MFWTKTPNNPNINYFLEIIHSPACFIQNVSDVGLCVHPQVKDVLSWAKSIEPVTVSGPWWCINTIIDFFDIYKNKELWAELITYFPLIRHGPNTKRRLQQFLHCCVCTRCRGNVFTEPLLINDRRETHTDTEADERDLWSTQLRWAQMPWCTYQISWRMIQAFKSWGRGEYTDT
jgi:hypothetical protein